MRGMVRVGVGVALLTVGFCAAGDTIVLSNTGANPNYTIITAPDPAYLGATKVVVPDGFPIPPWVANDADSAWITSAAADLDANGPQGVFVYRTTFTILPGQDPGTAAISGSWSSDNNGIDIRINGLGTGHSTDANAFTALHAFSITSGFVSGANTLDFVLNNGSGPTGLRVDDIQGTVQAAGTVVPLPAVAWGGVVLLGLAASRRR